MSHFLECRTEFRDPDALIAALVECGFDPSVIEQHQEAVPLYGYQGDERSQKAHIVIRKAHIGTGANDVGWERQPDGTYRAWISEFDAGVGTYAPRAQDARFNQVTQNRIRQEYAYQVIRRQQLARGRNVSRERLDNGELRVLISGYR